jgi:hypothetical protein
MKNNNSIVACNQFLLCTAKQAQTGLGGKFKGNIK